MIWTWIVTLLVGALIGWIASRIMRTDDQQGALANIIIGILGSLLGKYIFQDLLSFGGAAQAGAFSIAGVFWGVLGSLILILILKAVKVLN